MGYTPIDKDFSNTKTVHKLKTVNPFFEKVLHREKTAELRFNDRNFQILDYIILEEYIPDKEIYTGRKVLIRITHMVTEFDFDALKPGWVMLSFEWLGTPVNYKFIEPS